METTNMIHQTKGLVIVCMKCHILTYMFEKKKRFRQKACFV